MNCQKHATNVQMVQSHVRLIQTINPTSMQATRTCTMIKLPNKQYKTHTTIKLHMETIPLTILAGLLLDLASPSKFGKIHQCRTAQIIFYVDGTDPCSPSSLKVRNKIV